MSMAQGARVVTNVTGNACLERSGWRKRKEEGYEEVYGGFLSRARK
jgi:hypothetical protein